MQVSIDDDTITAALVTFQIASSEDVHDFNEHAQDKIKDFRATHGITDANMVPFGCELAPKLEKRGEGYVLTGEGEFSLREYSLPFVVQMWSHDYHDCWLEPAK